MIEWINAAERLPVRDSNPPFLESCRVLVACGGGFVKIGQYAANCHWIVDGGIVSDVTHWAELPVAPTGD